jgi:predicted secreted protein
MATFSQGAILKVGTTTLATVSEITSITPFEFSADEVETTTHGSTNRYREYIQGMRDGGSITIEGYFTTATASSTILLFETTSTLLTATVDLPTSPSVTRFTATVFVTAFSTEAPLDGVIGYSTTFKISGKPSLGQI